MLTIILCTVCKEAAGVFLTLGKITQQMAGMQQLKIIIIKELIKDGSGDTHSSDIDSTTRDKDGHPEGPNPGTLGQRVQIMGTIQADSETVMRA